MIFSKDKSFLRLAIEKSQDHEQELKTDYRLCAILNVGKNTYVGYNQKKTHPLQKQYGTNEYSIHLHAEIDCIRQAYRVEGYLGDATLYVARTRLDNSIATACPCKGCQKAITNFQIDSVYFTTDEGYGKLK